MSESQDAARRSGFLSEEDKRKFTTVAGILGAVFFVFQMIGPMVAMVVVMPLTMARASFETYSVEGSALYQGTVHVVARTQGYDRDRESLSRSQLVRAAEGELQRVVSLDGWDPYLLADGDRLWLVSSSRIAVLEGGRLVPLQEFEALGDICRPFLFQGAPTVIENRPDGGRLLRWEDGWKEMRALPDARGRCGAEPLVALGTVWLFRQEGKTLYVREAENAEARWVVVMSEPGRWYSFVKDGRPAVASVDFERGFRLVERDSGQRWTRDSESSSLSLHASEVAAFQEPSGSPIKVVTTGFPSSLAVRTLDDGRFTAVERFGRGFPFPAGMMWLMAVPQLGAVVLSLALAVILSGLMRKHRIATYTHGGAEVEYASLNRRALSEIIDATIVSLPGALVLPRTFSFFEEMFEGGPAAMLQLFGFIAGSLVWMGVMFLAFSFTEGRWGTTPGKWLFGIRVVGTDLAPCGLARALMRNALKFVDGFFNFLVGVLLVAFTPEWQRVGDLAARTLVVRVRQSPSIPAQSRAGS